MVPVVWALMAHPINQLGHRVSFLSLPEIYVRPVLFLNVLIASSANQNRSKHTGSLYVPNRSVWKTYNRKQELEVQLSGRTCVKVPVPAHTHKRVDVGMSSS